MIWNGIAWPLWLLGLALFAGLLYFLQRLRVRHREQVVVTTLFWQEAKEEARARTLVERFRHPLSYLLALGLVGLAWFAFADPERRDGVGERFTILLDGSFAMEAGDDFDQAKTRVVELVDNLPRRRTQVVLVGAGMRVLLGAGEDRSLLDQRFNGLTTEPVAPGLTRAMQVLGAATPIGNAGHSHTMIAVAKAVMAPTRLPEGVRWVHESVGESETESTDWGITTLGLAASAEGWSKVDALVTIKGSGPEPPTPGVMIGELPWRGVVRRTETPAGARFLLPGLPADGGLLHVQLGDVDGTPSDNSATVRLPNRPRLVVFVDPVLAGSPLDLMVRADAAFEWSGDPGGADVAVTVGRDLAPNLPALRLVSADAEPFALLLRHEAQLDSDQVLQFALGEFGLDRIDATEMANRVGKTISLGAEEGPIREFSLWRELIDDSQFSLVESRAFPLLMGRILRWLGQAEPVTPYVAANSPLPASLGPAGLAFAPDTVRMPIQAGMYVADSGETWNASLLPSWGGVSGALPRVNATGNAWQERGWHLLTWVLLAALFLLGCEWILYTQGRIP